MYQSEVWFLCAKNKTKQTTTTKNSIASPHQCTILTEHWLVAMKCFIGKTWMSCNAPLPVSVLSGMVVSDRIAGRGRFLHAMPHCLCPCCQEWSYRTGSLVVAGFYMLCSLVVFFGTKEKEGKPTPSLAAHIE